MGRSYSLPYRSIRSVAISATGTTGRSDVDFLSDFDRPLSEPLFLKPCL